MPGEEGCSVKAESFDFEAKLLREITLAEVRDEMHAGRFVWLDVDWTDADRARDVVGKLGLVMDEILEDAFTREPATQHARYDEYLHFVVSGCRLQGDKFDLERVDCVMAERFLITLHRGPVVFLDAVRKGYRQDFQRFARSPSFLVYELWDHLIENYLHVQKVFEERVERLQVELIGQVDDRVFARVSELGADLLHFRKVVMPSRAVLTDLSTRKSIFISEATQPFLGNMVGTLERVLQDLLVDRDILSESLNLYMSMVSHSTNRVMNRLTVISVIFLPLTRRSGARPA
jgi:magnesium transporter